MLEFLLTYEERQEAARQADRVAEACERANEICRQILASLDKESEQEPH